MSKSILPERMEIIHFNVGSSLSRVCGIYRDYTDAYYMKWAGSTERFYEARLRRIVELNASDDVPFYKRCLRSIEEHRWANRKEETASTPVPDKPPCCESTVMVLVEPVTSWYTLSALSREGNLSNVADVKNREYEFVERQLRTKVVQTQSWPFCTYCQKPRELKIDIRQKVSGCRAVITGTAYWTCKK